MNRPLFRLAAGAVLASSLTIPGAHAAPVPSVDAAEIRAFAAATHLSKSAARTYLTLNPAVGGLQARGVSEYATTFAGVWRTPADGGLVHVAFTRDASASAARLTAGFARRDLVRVTTARASLATLESLHARVAKALTGTPSTIAVDVIANVVSVSTPDVAAVRRAVGTHFAGAPVAVRAGRGATPVVAGVCADRICPGSASGGMELVGTDDLGVWSCTSGFDATTTLGVPVLVTAGHCFGVDTPVLNLAIPIGVVTARVWPGGDAEAITQLAPPTNDVDWISGIPDSHRTVTRVVGHGVSEAVGAGVCRTGITTQNQCGVIQALNVTVNYVSGETVFGLTQASNCVQPGDSGGPFMSNGDAYGITSGGTIGGCGGSSYSLYNPTTRIESSLGVRINASSLV